MVEPKKKLKYVRFTPVEERAIRDRAKTEDRKHADIIRRAVRSYVKMPVQDVAEPTPDEVTGRLFNEYSAEVRLVLWQIAEALTRGARPSGQIRKALGIPARKNKKRTGKAG